MLRAQTEQVEAREKDKGIRELTGTIRTMEGEGKERTFQLSFSSEEPYDRWFGTEILDQAVRGPYRIMDFNHSLALCLVLCILVLAAGARRFTLFSNIKHIFFTESP